MKPQVAAFFGQVDRLYGLYLDSMMGFRLVQEKIQKVQAEGIEMLKKSGQHQLATVEYLDQRRFTFGKGHPDAPDAKVLHVATQGEMKKRNEKDGQNAVAAGQMAIVGLFSFWEDVYRSEFAAMAGVAKNELRVPIMGDLRLLRISIIHHAGVSLREVERCEVLKWFKEGDVIAPSQAQMKIAFDEVAKFCVRYDTDMSPEKS